MHPVLRNMHASVLMSSICILIALAEGAKYFNVRRKKDDAIRKPIFTTHGVKDYHLVSDDGDVSLTTDATLGVPWEIQQPVTQHDGKLRSQASKASSFAEARAAGAPGQPLPPGIRAMSTAFHLWAGMEYIVCMVASAQLAVSIVVGTCLFIKYCCTDSLRVGYIAFMITVSGGLGWFCSLIAWPLFAPVIFVAACFVAKCPDTREQCMPYLWNFLGCCWVCKTSPVIWFVQMCGMGNDMRDVQDRLIMEMWWNPWTYVSGWFFGWDHGCIIPQSKWNDIWFQGERTNHPMNPNGPVGPAVGVVSK
eukprot:TRINITY_DN10629_c0_g1_i1.p1 TRINITY_DN10629_c0_g1~~TRINITY_DN10629_c0_g1_i1.p1  ORF type:complete len:306 (-),score=20.00 TRINITY_DN10629_c0_g1_i1:131-1048(-)